MAPAKVTRRPRPRITRAIPTAEPATDADAVRAAFGEQAGGPGDGRVHSEGAAAPLPPPAPAFGEGPIGDLERQQWQDQLHGLFKAAEEERGKHWHVPDAAKHVWGDYPAMAARKYGLGQRATKYPELMLALLILPYVAQGIRGEIQAYVEWRDKRTTAPRPQQRPTVVPFPATVTPTTPAVESAAGIVATPDQHPRAAAGGDERGGLRDQGLREIPPGTVIVGRSIESTDFGPSA